MVLLNLVTFQLGWFACVLGAAKGMFLLGPLSVCGFFILHLYLNRNIAREMTIGCIFVLCGFVTDTLLTFFHIYTPVAHLFPHPFSPPWLIFLWLNLATIFNVSLKWLHRRYFIATVLGGAGGGLSYYGGSSLGAVVFQEPLLNHVIITGVVWAVLTPLLFLTVTIINRRFAEKPAKEKLK